MYRNDYSSTSLRLTTVGVLNMEDVILSQNDFEIMEDDIKFLNP